MEEKTYASELAGHCNETTAWRILKEVSGDLIHNEIRPVNPFCIEINDDGHFALAAEQTTHRDSFDAPEHSENRLNEAEAAWSIGATLFYIVMGGEVMNGKGGKGQHESSKLPYMRSEWPELSELVQCCLHFNPSQRPSLQEIHKKAERQYQRCLDEIQRGPKIKVKEPSSPSGETNDEHKLSFWPETFLLFLCLLFSGHTLAQSKTDAELQRLTQAVATLRQSDKAHWDKALDFFKQDSLWTTMDEVIRDDNEYWLIGDKQFKLNAILNQCSGHDKKMVRGDFLNGNDPHYNYSLTERGIKGMCSVSYEMSYREGRQIFVVMPYTTMSGNLEVKAYLNDQSVGETTIDAGNTVLTINTDVKKSDILRLVITNLGNENMSVVIINHNTRKP